MYMKLEPLTKLHKEKKTLSKKFDDDVMLENYGIIAIFPIYGKFRAIQKPNFRRIVCKIYIFINSTLF